MLLAYKQLPSQSVISIWELLTYWAGVYIHEGPRLTLQLLVLHFVYMFRATETGHSLRQGLSLSCTDHGWNERGLNCIISSGTELEQFEVVVWLSGSHIHTYQKHPSFLPVDNIGINFETWNGNTYVQSCKMQPCCQKWSVMQLLVPVTKWK
jgi:hypothetical protein